MEELSELLAPQSKNHNLVERMINLLDRQTDHKLHPNTMIGFLGLFNLLSIMSLVHGDIEGGYKDFSALSGSGGADQIAGGQSITDLLSGLLNGQDNTASSGSSGSSGQPDLMGLLGTLASKKKVNPNLLLSLFSMLNNQAGSGAASVNNAAAVEGSKGAANVPVDEDKGAKTTDEKSGVELKYDRRRGTAERS